MTEENNKNGLGRESDISDDSDTRDFVPEKKTDTSISEGGSPEDVQTMENIEADSRGEESQGEGEMDPISRLTAEIEKAEAEKKEAEDRSLRVSAEFENYKKRSAKEVAAFKKFANESLAKDLLPVVDNLERAIGSASAENKDESIVEGIHLTLKEILKVLEKFGVKQIEAMGQTFDPGFHEAVMQEESDEHPENVVIREFQKGYTIHERLLRPAMVVVSKAK